MPRYQTPFAAGDTLNNQFRLLRPLGVGGLGDVWEAQRLGSNVGVALKILQPQFIRSFEHTSRLEREFAVLSAIRDMNVVQCMGQSGLTDWKRGPKNMALGQARGLPFLELALVEGETLSRKLARARSSGASRFARAIPLRTATLLFEPLLRVLAGLHAKGIVHRDLKPGNIVIGANKRATLLDWNLGKVPENQADLTTLAHRSCGSRPYCCPSQYEQLLSAGPRADIYSMAAVMVEALTGFHFKEFCDERHLPRLEQIKQTLLHGTDLGPARPVVRKARFSKAPVPAGRGPQIPRFLAHTLLRALALSPDERPESIEELRQALLVAERGTENRTVAVGSMDDEDEPTVVQNETTHQYGARPPAVEEPLAEAVALAASLTYGPGLDWQAEWRRWGMAIAAGSLVTLAITWLF